MATQDKGGRPSGPRLPGLDGGRKRNTAANIYSKYETDYSPKGGAQVLPALSPSATASYYSQLGGLHAQYSATLADLRSQRVGLRTNFASARAEAKAGVISGLAGVQNEADDRGVGGSSASSQAEIGVRAQGAADVANARNVLTQGFSQLASQKQQAGVALYQGVAGLQADALASQEEAAAQALQNNLIISGEETQMDALKAFYNGVQNSIAAAGSPPPGGGGNGGTGGGGGGGRQGPLQVGGTLNQANRQKLLSDYYAGGNPAGSGIGLPYPGRPGVRF